jgi:hypothetical protein
MAACLFSRTKMQNSVSIHSHGYMPMTNRATIVAAIETLRKARCNFVLEYPGPGGNASAGITVKPEVLLMRLEEQ